MAHEDCRWAVHLVERHTTGARWIKVIREGETRFTVGVRIADTSDSDEEIRGREEFFASLHPDVWQCRLASRNRDGETYYITFSKPKQLSLF